MGTDSNLPALPCREQAEGLLSLPESENDGS